jgi:hypothetical protein
MVRKGGRLVSHLKPKGNTPRSSEMPVKMAGLAFSVQHSAISSERMIIARKQAES